MNTVANTFAAPGPGKTRKVQVVITRTDDIGPTEWALMNDIAELVHAWYEATAPAKRSRSEPPPTGRATDDRRCGVR